ncbi:TIM barrel protein [Paenibacillus chibensis]|uniref:TIM barrel protein n=1 Tax=Paenibacillus chibensis TaxID=59846 RepID=A0ABU6PS15_9BACL|nr:TIM barrel protein [Paenibacillus chibensis]
MLGYSIQDPVFQGILTRRTPHDLIGGCDSVNEFLHWLKEQGVCSIEVRILPRHANPIAYADVIQRIWDAGLKITVHGHVEGNMVGNRFEDVYPSMKYILRHLGNHQDEVMMAIHAYDAASGSEEQLFGRTVELFREWTSIVEHEQLPLRFALENNRKKTGKVDPGDTTAGVLDMVKQVGSPLLGITWDMGHFYSDLLHSQEGRKLQVPILDLPEPEFIRRVVHTHIHGIGSRGTHQPLTDPSSLPLTHYVQALQNAGYQGIYNLELTMSKFGSDRPILDHASASIQRLKKAVLNG